MFFVEPWFPLGDSRWLVVLVVCFISALFLIRSEAPLSATRTAPRSQEGVLRAALAKVIEKEPELALLIVGAAVVIISFLTFIGMIWMIWTMET